MRRNLFNQNPPILGDTYSSISNRVKSFSNAKSPSDIHVVKRRRPKFKIIVEELTNEIAQLQREKESWQSELDQELVDINQPDDNSTFEKKAANILPQEPQSAESLNGNSFTQPITENHLVKNGGYFKSISGESSEKFNTNNEQNNSIKSSNETHDSKIIKQISPNDEENNENGFSKQINKIDENKINDDIKESDKNSSASEIGYELELNHDKDESGDSQQNTKDNILLRSDDEHSASKQINKNDDNQINDQMKPSNENYEDSSSKLTKETKSNDDLNHSNNENENYELRHNSKINLNSSDASLIDESSSSEIKFENYRIKSNIFIKSSDDNSESNEDSDIKQKIDNNESYDFNYVQQINDKNIKQIKDKSQSDDYFSSLPINFDSNEEEKQISSNEVQNEQKANEKENLIQVNDKSNSESVNSNDSYYKKSFVDIQNGQIKEKENFDEGFLSLKTESEEDQEITNMNNKTDNEQIQTDNYLSSKYEKSEIQNEDNIISNQKQKEISNDENIKQMKENQQNSDEQNYVIDKECELGFNPMINSLKIMYDEKFTSPETFIYKDDYQSDKYLLTKFDSIKENKQNYVYVANDFEMQNFGDETSKVIYKDEFYDIDRISFNKNECKEFNLNNALPNYEILETHKNGAKNLLKYQNNQYRDECSKLTNNQSSMNTSNDSFVSYKKFMFKLSPDEFKCKNVKTDSVSIPLSILYLSDNFKIPNNKKITENYMQINKALQTETKVTNETNQISSKEIITKNDKVYQNHDHIKSISKIKFQDKILFKDLTTDYKIAQINFKSKSSNETDNLIDNKFQDKRNFDEFKLQTNNIQTETNLTQYSQYDTNQYNLTTDFNTIYQDNMIFEEFSCPPQINSVTRDVSSDEEYEYEEDIIKSKKISEYYLKEIEEEQSIKREIEEQINGTYKYDSSFKIDECNQIDNHNVCKVKNDNFKQKCTYIIDADNFKIKPSEFKTKTKNNISSNDDFKLKPQLIAEDQHSQYVKPYIFRDKIFSSEFVIPKNDFKENTSKFVIKNEEYKNISDFTIKNNDTFQDKFTIDDISVINNDKNEKSSNTKSRNSKVKNEINMDFNVSETICLEQNETQFLLDTSITAQITQKQVKNDIKFVCDQEYQINSQEKLTFSECYQIDKGNYKEIENIKCKFDDFYLDKTIKASNNDYKDNMLFNEFYTTNVTNYKDELSKSKDVFQDKMNFDEFVSKHLHVNNSDQKSLIYGVELLIKDSLIENETEFKFMTPQSYQCLSAFDLPMKGNISEFKIPQIKYDSKSFNEFNVNSTKNEFHDKMIFDEFKLISINKADNIIENKFKDKMLFDEFIKSTNETDLINDKFQDKIIFNEFVLKSVNETENKLAETEFQNKVIFDEFNLKSTNEIDIFDNTFQDKMTFDEFKLKSTNKSYSTLDNEFQDKMLFEEFVSISTNETDSDLINDKFQDKVIFNEFISKSVNETENKLNNNEFQDKVVFDEFISKSTNEIDNLYGKFQDKMTFDEFKSKLQTNDTQTETNSTQYSKYDTNQFNDTTEFECNYQDTMIFEEFHSTLQINSLPSIPSEEEYYEYEEEEQIISEHFQEEVKEINIVNKVTAEQQIQVEEIIETNIEDQQITEETIKDKEQQIEEEGLFNDIPTLFTSYETPLISNYQYKDYLQSTSFQDILNFDTYQDVYKIIPSNKQENDKVEVHHHSHRSTSSQLSTKERKSPSLVVTFKQQNNIPKSNRKHLRDFIRDPLQQLSVASDESEALMHSLSFDISDLSLNQIINDEPIIDYRAFYQSSPFPIRPNPNLPIPTNYSDLIKFSLQFITEDLKPKIHSLNNKIFFSEVLKVKDKSMKTKFVITKDNFFKSKLGIYPLDKIIAKKSFKGFVIYSKKGELLYELESKHEKIWLRLINNKEKISDLSIISLLSESGTFEDSLLSPSLYLEQILLNSSTFPISLIKQLLEFSLRRNLIII